MTPREMLAPQPAPVRSERTTSVLDALLNSNLLDGLDPIVAELLVLRREQGVAVYGAELGTHNGRDARVDELQEQLDAAMYAMQRRAEDSGNAFGVRLALRRVEELAGQLRNVPAPPPRLPRLVLESGWHLLSFTRSDDGRLSHVMAARDYDGIGVLAIWSRDADGAWSCWVVDTEAGGPLHEVVSDDNCVGPPIKGGGA